MAGWSAGFISTTPLPTLFGGLVRARLMAFALLLGFGFLAIVLLVIAAKTIRIVPQATVMLVERLGRFDKIASSGLNLLVPFLDRPRAVYWTNTRPGITSIDLREQYLDLPPQA